MVRVLLPESAKKKASRGSGALLLPYEREREIPPGLAIMGNQPRSSYEQVPLVKKRALG